MLHKVFILQFMCTVCVLVGVWRETGKHVVFVCVCVCIVWWEWNQLEILTLPIEWECFNLIAFVNRVDLFLNAFKQTMCTKAKTVAVRQSNSVVLGGCKMWMRINGCTLCRKQHMRLSIFNVLAHALPFVLF